LKKTISIIVQIELERAITITVRTLNSYNSKVYTVKVTIAAVHTVNSRTTNIT
jgi:hypothetical protein